MIIPIRCFTCNKVVGHLWNDYCEMVQQRKQNQRKGQEMPERFYKKRSS